MSKSYQGFQEIFPQNAYVQYNMPFFAGKNIPDTNSKLAWGNQGVVLQCYLGSRQLLTKNRASTQNYNYNDYDDNINAQQDNATTATPVLQNIDHHNIYI